FRSWGAAGWWWCSRWRLRGWAGGSALGGVDLVGGDLQVLGDELVVLVGRALGAVAGDGLADHVGGEVHGVAGGFHAGLQGSVAGEAEGEAVDAAGGGLAGDAGARVGAGVLDDADDVPCAGLAGGGLQVLGEAGAEAPARGRVRGRGGRGRGGRGAGGGGRPGRAGVGPGGVVEHEVGAGGASAEAEGEDDQADGGEAERGAEHGGCPEVGAAALGWGLYRGPRRSGGLLVAVRRGQRPPVVRGMPACAEAVAPPRWVLAAPVRSRLA